MGKGGAGKIELAPHFTGDLNSLKIFSLETSCWFAGKTRRGTKICREKKTTGKRCQGT